jgi:hypothetical protein
MIYATTRQTTTLYTVGQRSKESRSYAQVLSVASRDQAIARMTHYGVEQKTARELTQQAHAAAHAALELMRENAPSASAELALPSAVHGDAIDSDDAPYGERFRIIATVVSAPGVPVA